MGVLACMLDMSGCQLGAVAVDGAVDGHAALAWLGSAISPSLLLIDLEMPGMDGV
ncbi:response regulator, partial [Xanthomonas arboricola]|uniref:response regulator n=1 Tax=Xanthomonas arboricola TaxID=56448 RepID=UPI0011B09542